MKNALIHASPTVRQHTVKLLIAIAAIHGFSLWTPDVTQAYLQSAERLSRKVYLRAPYEFNLTSDELLKLLKPLYGLSGSGDYWHHTFKGHLRRDLSMTQATGDLSLWFKSVEQALNGMIAVYVGDQLSAGTPAFEEETKITERQFQSRPRKYDHISFAGVEISQRPDGSVLMHQRPHADRIQHLPKSCTFAEFRSGRQELAWIGHTRPDVAAVANMASQITTATFTPNHVKLLNDCIKHVK